MSPRLDYSKDGMVSSGYAFQSITNPGDGVTVFSDAVTADGAVIGIAASWTGTAPICLRLYVGAALKFSFTVAAAGASNIYVPGRIDYSNGDSVSIITDGAATGTLKTALVVASA